MAKVGPTKRRRNSDAKPATPEEFVTLVVTDDEGRRFTRTMRATDQLQVLMDYYYSMVPIANNDKGVFMRRRLGQRVGNGKEAPRDPFSGSPFGGLHTPADLGVKDGDEIHFYFVPEVELVTPVLQDFRGRRFTRTMRRTEGMQGLMDFYNDMVPAAAAADGGIFLYRGERIAGDQTPDDLQLKHWDMIYFVPRRRDDVVEEKADSFLTIHVNDATSSKKGTAKKVYLTMRTTDKIQVLMDYYYHTVPTEPWGGQFLHDGNILSSNRTPTDYKIEDGDELDYFTSIR